MSQLKPKRIVLHCGLHKTGSTYIQRNLERNRELLLEQGVLYLGPKIFKNRCAELWRHLQWGDGNRRTSISLQSQTKTSLLELTGEHPETIHTIVLSFESIFGTLRNGLIGSNRKKTPNKEHKIGLYRYAESRTRRLMRGLEDSLEQQSIAWTVLFASRDPEDFIRSCHTQLIKEGHHTPKTSNFETFRDRADFSYSNPERLTQTISKLRSQRDLKIVNINYEQSSDPNEPSALLWNVLRQALPEQTEQIRQQLAESNSNNKLNNMPNPGLNARGLVLALQARHLFSHSEWKLFRKFLEKNFAKTL